MKNHEIEETLENHKQSILNLANYINNTLAITTRYCQKCEIETVQKVLARYPAIYRCLNCGTTWKPRIPDDQISEDEVNQEPIGFKTDMKGGKDG